MRLVLFEPEIPQNTASMLRLCACLGVSVDIIEPCGFVFDDRKLKRVGMDYIDVVDYTLHSSWDAFKAQLSGRLVLLTTKATTPYTSFSFEENDCLMVGRESSGVPEDIARGMDHKIKIPLCSHTRSLNVAQAATLVVGEALRQLDGFPR